MEYNKNTYLHTHTAWQWNTSHFKIQDWKDQGLNITICTWTVGPGAAVCWNSPLDLCVSMSKCVDFTLKTMHFLHHKGSSKYSLQRWMCLCWTNAKARIWCQKVILKSVTLRSSTVQTLIWISAPPAHAYSRPVPCPNVLLS